MDGNVQQQHSRASSFAMSSTSPPNHDDDSDSISLTSTRNDDDDEENLYVVESVHAEELQDGERLFLIEWANYPLDLCTWEPLENLNEKLSKEWEEKKATQDPSVSRDFVTKYEIAYNEKLEETRLRHRRRNAKRRKLGIPTTSFRFREREISDSEDEIVAPQEIADSEAESLSYSSDGSREAREDNAVDHRASAALIKPSKSAKSKPSSSKSKEKRPARPQVNSIFGISQRGDQKSVSTKRTDAKSTPASGSTIEKPKAGKQASSDRERPSTTGYQGSARRVSATSPVQPVGVNTKPSASSVVKTAAGSGTTANAGIAKSSTVRPNKTTVSKAMGPTGTAPPAHKPSSVPASAPSQAAHKGKSTMKRSSQAAVKTAVNIFSETDGRKKKTKPTMAEMEIDKTQQPRLNKNARQNWASQKRSRERDDQAPPIERINPAQYAPGFLPQQVQASTQVRNDAGGSAEVTAPPQEQRSTAPPLQDARSSSTAGNPIPVRVAKRPLRSVLSSIADRPGKKAKSVRFTETELGPSLSQEAFQRISSMEGERFPREGDPVKIIDDDDDDGLFVGEPMDIDDDAAASIPLIAPRKLDLSTYKSRSHGLISVDKKIKLSTSTELLDVIFDAFPSRPAQDTDQWLREFLGTDCLDIGHSFLAESLVEQLGKLTYSAFRSLCSGVLRSDDSNESLNILAEHLRLTSSGLSLARKLFNLVLFPTKCADFDGLSNFGVDLASPGPGNVALRYFIFSSDVPIFQLMRPSLSPTKRLKSTIGKEKLLLFPTILGMQYSSLIAPYEKEAREKLNVYLAFPERALPWQHSIASWLTMRNSKCKIYTNFDAGSWLAFLEFMKTERGLLIIHEALVPFIRRLPQLHKLLKTSVIVWQFSEAMGPEPPRPLANLSIVPVIPTRFSRIFPMGHVILLTPSFLLSEPREAYKIIKWFFTCRAKNQTNKLVLAYNIVDFLSSLYQEKTECRNRLKQGAWRFQREIDIAVEKNAAALTDDDLAARQKIWFFLDMWLSEQMHNDIPFSELNSVIFADRSIDPHDEQSLVNWFGTWSMMHRQDYRRFYVVGSSGHQPTSPDNPPTTRTSRTMQIPKYHPSVVNDPDKAMRNSLSKAGQPFTPTLVLQSQCFANDEANIQPWLVSRARERRADCQRRFGNDPFWDLYTKPVSWANGDMANRLGDSAMQFATIKQWWDTIQPWSAVKNTYIAFFYTISDDEWRPENYSGGTMPKRNAWLAIWRPCEVHFKKDAYAHGRTELVIWDTRAGDQLEANFPPGHQDLTWMQRALVDFIKLHAHEKNSGSYLHRTWVGGSQAQRAELELRSVSPVDVTAEMLADRLLFDLNNALPSPPYALQKHKYREMTANEGPQDSSSTNQDASLYGSEDDLDSRMIFHPPRGSENLQPETPSRCINGLFEASRLARLQQQNSMVYTFPPTLSWYQHQVAEGRQFEHIMVDKWERIIRERIFSESKVYTDASAPPSATSARPQTGLSRNDSVSSNHSSSTY